jgi:hypothetical protein
MDNSFDIEKSRLRNHSLRVWYFCFYLTYPMRSMLSGPYWEPKCVLCISRILLTMLVKVVRHKHYFLFMFWQKKKGTSTATHLSQSQNKPNISTTVWHRTSPFSHVLGCTRTNLFPVSVRVMCWISCSMRQAGLATALCAWICEGVTQLWTPPGYLSLYAHSRIISCSRLWTLPAHRQ